MKHNRVLKLEHCFHTHETALSLKISIILTIKERTATLVTYYFHNSYLQSLLI